VKFLDLTCPTPAENLAWDEALLDLCEEDGTETLRLWESREPFVVVGYGNAIDREVLVDECGQRGVSILRRCSGGGTVVQGPGCLNYSVTLNFADSIKLQTVTAANRFVMERNRAALQKSLGRKVLIQGHTDLAFADDAGILWKFSGNAQRRRRRALLFHGTVLHSFDLSLIDALLRFPSAQPEYRAGRRHSEFVRNLPLEPVVIRETISTAWSAHEPLTGISSQRVRTDKLLREHYLNEQWNRSR
jgi:lipoate---protein ligase